MGTQLLISLIFSSIGAGYFIYGKKEAEFFFMLMGAILCFYPYVVTSTVPMIVAGVALMAAPFVAERFWG